MSEPTDEELLGMVREPTDEELLGMVKRKKDPLEEAKLNSERIANEFDRREGALKEDLASTAISALTGPSMGLADELYGAAKAVGKRVMHPSRMFDEKAPSFAEDYRTARDQIRGAQDENVARHPYAPIAGAIIASGPVGGLKTAAGRVGSAALLGGLSGFGSSRSDSIKGDIANTAIGAGIGGAMGGVAEGVGAGAKYISEKAAPGFAEWLKKMAANRAIASLKPNQTDVKALQNRGIYGDVGLDLIESGAVKPWSSVEEIADRVDELLEGRGQTHGMLIDDIDKIRGGKTVPRIDVLKSIRDAFNYYDKRSGQARIQDIIKEQAHVVRSQHPEKFLSLRDAEGRLKGSYDDQVTQYFRTNEPSDRVAAFASVRDAIKKANENAVANVTSNDTSELSRNLYSRFMDSKKAYGNMSAAAQILGRSGLPKAANRQFGITDYMSGIAGASSSETPVLSGVTSALINKILRDRGSSATAVALNSASKAISRLPDAAISRLPAASLESAMVPIGSQAGRYADSVSKSAVPASKYLSEYFGLSVSDEDAAKAGFISGNGGLAPNF